VAGFHGVLHGLPNHGLTSSTVRITRIITTHVKPIECYKVEKNIVLIMAKTRSHKRGGLGSLELAGVAGITGVSVFAKYLYDKSRKRTRHRRNFYPKLDNMAYLKRARLKS